MSRWGYRTDDPVRDFDLYDRDQNEWLNRRPVCSGCRDRIQEGHAYEVRGRYYCEECQDVAWEKVKLDYLVVIDD